jgi:Ca2+/H+ antiporter, TMEM165/GDT1 family
VDALMAALVAAALAHVADRPAWLAAILADRFGVGRVLLAAALALAATAALAVLGGLLLRPLLTPEAAQLFLALALVLQGADGIGRLRAPDPLAGWRLGGTLTATLGLFILMFGDGLQLIVAALALRSPLPWLALAGAILGGLAAVAPAAVLGEAAWRRWPLVALRRASAALFVIAGLWIGLSGLRLV